MVFEDAVGGTIPKGTQQSRIPVLLLFGEWHRLGRWTTMVARLQDLIAAHEAACQVSGSRSGGGPRH